MPGTYISRESFKAEESAGDSVVIPAGAMLSNVVVPEPTVADEEITPLHQVTFEYERRSHTATLAQFFEAGGCYEPEET